MRDGRSDRYPRRIQAAAWNLGIHAATGDVIGILSGHAELSPSYVGAAVTALDRTGADMVGGPVRAIGEGPVAEAIAVATSSTYGAGGARFRLADRVEDVDTVFMGLASRSIYQRHLFDEEMVRNQDDELSYRLLDDGARIVCDPAIGSRYRSRATLRGLARQYFAYGMWKVRVVQKHPRQVRLRHLAPIALVATLAGGAVLAPVSRTVRALLVVELGLYAAALAAACARYGSGRVQTAGLLAVVYPVLHISYGSGMLRGLWQFRGRRRPPPTAATGTETDPER